MKWQLNLEKDLEKIEHLLRGEISHYDEEKGRTVWKPNPDEDKVPFNAYGVDLILNIISFYVNRNTLLSNYDEATINMKVFDFGNEIKDLIFMKYDEMGMDDPKKMKMYPMIVRELVDVVHSAYLRALGGGERESLRRQVQVSQTENLAMPQMQARRTMNPFSWLKS